MLQLFRYIITIPVIITSQLEQFITMNFPCSIKNTVDTFLHITYLQTRIANIRNNTKIFYKNYDLNCRKTSQNQNDCVIILLRKIYCTVYLI